MGWKTGHEPRFPVSREGAGGGGKIFDLQFFQLCTPPPPPPLNVELPVPYHGCDDE